jgi:D-lactate dehydrogenase
LRILQEEGKGAEYKKLLDEYQYAGLDTCATDGLCQLDCPVEINTGELVKRLRSEQHGAFANKVAVVVSNRFMQAEWLVRVLLRSGYFLNGIFGKKFMPKLTGAMQKMVPAMPLWWDELTKPPKRIWHEPPNPRYVYLSACIQRMMGNDAAQGSVQAAMLSACQKAGIQLLLPKELPGHCCGQAFSSKGYFEAAKIRQRALIDALWAWTNAGALPVVCDFTSCTYTILKAGASLEEPWKTKLKNLKILDSIQFLNDVVVPQLPLINRKNRIVLHPGCAATKMQLIEPMKQAAGKLALEVIIPADAGCCGMAGDRGFLFPELTDGATKPELKEAVLANADGYYASAKTCEMALTHFSGKNYKHLVYLVGETAE